jgi:frataxin-like iron-binding protein CyaY
MQMILDRMNVMSIWLATKSTDNHFKEQPIFGIVDSMTDENGNKMIQTTQQASSAAGNATGGNMT